MKRAAKQAAYDDDRKGPLRIEPMPCGSGQRATILAWPPAMVIMIGRSLENGAFHGSVGDRMAADAQLVNIFPP